MRNPRLPTCSSGQSSQTVRPRQDASRHFHPAQLHWNVDSPPTPQLMRLRRTPQPTPIGRYTLKLSACHLSPADPVCAAEPCRAPLQTRLPGRSARRFTPIADAYVWGSSYATSGYGAASQDCASVMTGRGSSGTASGHTSQIRFLVAQLLYYLGKFGYLNLPAVG